MNNLFRYACLQISVKFHIPRSKSVKRQVLDTSYILLLCLDAKHVTAMRIHVFWDLTLTAWVGVNS